MEPDLNLALYPSLLTILYAFCSMGIPEVMPFHQICFQMGNTPKQKV